LSRFENDPIQNGTHLTNQSMSILVSQETTAENQAQQETFLEPEWDSNDNTNQGVGTSQPSLQATHSVHMTSLHPTIQINIKKWLLPPLIVYLMEQDLEKQKAT
jgi:hypothetical protein